MKVTFLYFAQVRSAAGSESESIALPGGAGLADALAFLSRKHGDRFRAIVLDAGGRPRPSLIVLVNGVPAAKGGDAPLKDGDEVSLLSAVAGG